MRVGIGYDVHKLVPNRALIIGGVQMPYQLGLAGHSDADVLVHAIMDALLGAAGLGDIGRHFPDSDDKYKGISSLKLLDEVRDKLDMEGYIINNLDAVVVAQAPKMAPHIPVMRGNIATVLGLDQGMVNIKATTTEHLGFAGRGEGVGAYATCSIKEK
ncbi:MAG: 2-C-methyl-D-erythritol 2,4-cyclodiphosphate synthase [Firmicutes bacterium]|nr:2-C-methyl-D-erythritol 2,4-cyclodiphosphate synthase [Bacillota bacterium]